MSDAMLDTRRQVITPEGVPLQLPAAGPLPRALAWLLDLLIRFCILFLMAIPLMFLDELGQGIHSVIMFLVFWAYPILFEALWRGQTPGKRALGLRVIAADGAPLGWMPAITRNLLRTVDMLPIGYALGLLCTLFDRHGRRLGDLVARSQVVHVSARPETVKPVVESVVAPPLPLRPDEQAALLAYAERAPRLSAGRQVELAELARPLTGTGGQAGVLRMYAMANWLLGRR